jgi:hypothetical protein
MGFRPRRAGHFRHILAMFDHDVLRKLVGTVSEPSWRKVRPQRPLQKQGTMNGRRAPLSEMVTAIAAEQWRSARQSVEDFKKLQDRWQSQADATPNATTLHDRSGRLLQNLERIKASPWSMRHAFFADMGGIILQCSDFSPFPVVAYQINQLVAKGHLACPSISRTEIWDKNKAD